MHESKCSAGLQCAAYFPLAQFPLDLHTLCKYSYAGQGEYSLQNFMISTDVELEGDSGRWPDLVHDVSHVIPQYL